MNKEQSLMSEGLDKDGLEQGDIIEVIPLTGRKYKFSLNRTEINFLSDDLMDDSACSKRLGRLDYESFHVRLSVVKTLGKHNKSKSRYKLSTIKGSGVKLNGQWVIEAFIERGDRLEVGFNKIIFSHPKEEIALDSRENFLENNKSLIQSRLSILLIGQTGVGKTSLAKKIHKASHRKGKFVHLNISSFSKNLIESELFGHIKGAFTGASMDKKGSLKEAHQGTLFLDEIDSLSKELQVKLLLFLDDYKIRAVGSSYEEEIDVRVILSSGRDLLELVNKDLMRKDFYYRITSGQIIHLPALRDRPERIKSFCESFSHQHGVLIKKNLIDFYFSLPWPGNYRQLEGHLHTKLVMAKGNKLDFDELDERLLVQSSELFEMNSQLNPPSLGEVKNAYIKKVFYESQSNYQVAAKKLKVSSRSIRNIIGEKL